MLTLLNPDPVFVTFRDNSVVITGVHREDLTQAQCDAARVRLIQTLHQIAPGVIGEVISTLTVDPAPRELVYPMTTSGAAGFQTPRTEVDQPTPIPADTEAAGLNSGETASSGVGDVLRSARPVGAFPAGRAVPTAVSAEQLAVPS